MSHSNNPNTEFGRGDWSLIKIKKVTNNKLAKICAAKWKSREDLIKALIKHGEETGFNF